MIDLEIKVQTEPVTRKFRIRKEVSDEFDLYVKAAQEKTQGADESLVLETILMNHFKRDKGLNLVTAAIALWNTVYLDLIIKSRKEQRRPVDQLLMQNLSPLRWEHMNRTGDYVWRNRFKGKDEHFRALRPLPIP